MESVKHLFTYWPKLQNKIRAQFIFLFLDYDGTLTPIVEKIDDAVLSSEARNLLNKLSVSPECRVAIISGRNLENIKRLIGIKGLIYAGNHGLEIEGPKLKFEHPIYPGYKQILSKIKNKLSEELSAIKGVIVEDKGICLSFHYRLVDKQEIFLAKSIFRDVTLPYKKNKLIMIRAGKMLLEVRPPVEWGKGETVLWLFARQQFAVGDNKLIPIYIGDDKTDEDAFVAIKDKGLSIFVGEPGVTNADFYVKNSQEVMEFLNLIIKEFETNAGFNKG